MATTAKTTNPNARTGLAEATAARDATQAEVARVRGLASGEVGQWVTRRALRTIITVTGQPRTVEADEEPVWQTRSVPLAERLAAKRQLAVLEDELLLAEEAVAAATGAAQDAARWQRAEAIRAGEAAVQRELPALIAELRTAQQHMVAFAERMAQLDVPLEGEYFQAAPWALLLPGQAFDTWVAHVAGMFKLERPT
jgi:hypothetical protein